MKKGKIIFFTVTLIGVIACKSPNVAEENTATIDKAIVIDVNAVIKDCSNSGIGISLNHYTEHSGVSRTVSFATASQTMKLKSLRWPEGELGESLMWSAPPYDKPNPTPTMRGGVWPCNSSTLFDQTTGKPRQTLDFDQFVQLCKQVNAEPFVIIPIDAVQKPDGVTSYVSEEQILQNASEMVKYAKAKGYNIKYWEIGNENDLDVSGTKTKQRWPAQSYADFVVKISKVMKAQDASIHIGANGMTTTAWWETLIKTAAPSIDFLVTHAYYIGNSTKSLSSGTWYDNYRLGIAKKWDFNPGIATLTKAIDSYASEGDKARLKIAVTETSPYAPGGDVAYYPDKNNFGTSVIAFETLGKMLANPRLLYAHFWTSHWFGATSIRDALGPNNEITPIGRAIQLLNEALLTNMVSVSPMNTVMDADHNIMAFHENGKVNVLIVNRGEEAKNVPLLFKNANLSKRPSTAVWQLKATSPEDASPTFTQLSNIQTNANSFVEVVSPGFSITVLKF